MNHGNSSYLEAALAYARLDWPVFPLAPGTKVPLKGTHGFADATTDLDQIRRWWRRWPKANIGLHPGAAGLLAIDLDVKGDVDGLEAWRALKAKHGFDDDTLTSLTPSGGRHLIFARPPGLTGRISNRGLGPGMDVRADEGYILLSPSELYPGQLGGAHPGEGGGAGPSEHCRARCRAYTWQPEASPWNRCPAVAPAPLVALLAARQLDPGSAAAPEAGTASATPGKGDKPALPRPLPAAGSAYGRAALQSELDRLAATAVGDRNNQLNRTAFALGQLVAGGYLDRSAVETALAQAAGEIGLGAGEVRATINSGLEAGAKEPRSSPMLGMDTRPTREADSRSPARPTPGEPAVLQPGDAAECPPLPPAAKLPSELGAEACRWLDEYIAYSRKWSPRSFDGFHEACALWLLSTIAARRVMVHFGRARFTNLYIQLAGRTTMFAKSSAAEIALAVLLACNLGYLLAPDEATPQSLLRALAGGDLPPDFDHLSGEQQTQARLQLGFCGQRGWLAEEFGSWTASMMRVDGVMADFRGLMRRFDDCPDKYSRSTIARGTELVKRPYLAVLGILTPADLRPLARKGTQLWGDGFLARFAFVTPPHDAVLTTRFPQGPRVIPPSLTRPLVAWHQGLGLPQVTIQDHRDGDGKLTGDKIVTIVSPDPQVCDLTSAAEDALYAYNRAVLEIARTHEQTDLDGNYGRLHEKALRVAALLASLGNEGRIELWHWARAQEIAERWRLYTHRLYDQVTRAQASPVSEIEDKILNALKRWQGTVKYPDGLTASEISRYVWGLGRTEVRYYADQLVQAGVLDRHPGKRAQRYLIPRPDLGDQACRPEKST
jgi:hypothetical protein